MWLTGAANDLLMVKKNTCLEITLLNEKEVHEFVENIFTYILVKQYRKDA